MFDSNDWRNQIKLEDLPEIYQDMAEYSCARETHCDDAGRFICRSQ
jgi:hypothetical protein